MIDPYPEARRRQRLDSTDHQRAAAERRRRAYERGPTGKQIQRALDAVLEADIPGTPSASHAAALKDGVSLPVEAESRVVRHISITQGDPQHGAYRSDTHVSGYTVAFPLAEAKPDAGVPDECPECASLTGVFNYRAHHYIAGSESITCEECDKTLYSHEWG